MTTRPEIYRQEVAQSIVPELTARDDEPVRAALDRPSLSCSVAGSVTPSIVEGPGPVQITATVRNTGTALAQDVLLQLQWPQVPINGLPQYLTFKAVSMPIESFDPVNGTVVVSLGSLAPGATVSATLTVEVPAGVGFGQQLLFTSRASAGAVPCPVRDAVDAASATVRFLPVLRVVKNDVVDLIPTGGFIDYTLTVRNLGDAPAHGAWIVDRLPNESVFVSATGPQGEQVWFSQTDNLPPSFLTPLQPLDARAIAYHFTPGLLNDNGTPGDPSDDVWTSPFGSQTRWMAWLMDDTSFLPPLYPVGAIRTVGFRVQNDFDGPGPNTVGSPDGTQIFNSVGIFSEELIQAIGNEVVTTIKSSPGILVEKSGPQVVTSGQQFTWVVHYYNNSAEPNETTVVTDTLPAGVSFVSATHVWNAAALGNGAPSDNNGQPVPSSVTVNPDGTTTLVFNIANATSMDGYRGSFGQLGSTEGGTITIVCQVDSVLPSGALLMNHVTGAANNSYGSTTSRDENEVEVRNADVRVTKVAQPPQPVSGDTVTYTLIVANDGRVPAANVVLVDTLPVGLTYVPNSMRILSPNFSIGEPVVAGRTLTWSVANGNALTRAGLPPGTLPAQSGDVFIQYRLMVAAGVVADTRLPNAVVISTDTPEDSTTDNQSAAQVRTPNPDLAIEKTGPAFVQAGDRFSWTLSYWNNTRQTAANVYVVDTLPDYTGDGQADVTFISQTATGPGLVTAYYHSGPSNPAPAFDPGNPLANGWIAGPPLNVNHIAWLIGALPGEAGPYHLTVTVDAIQPSSGLPLPASVELTNVARIAATDDDDDVSNNESGYTTRTPGNDILLRKTIIPEGSFPRVTPGDHVTYVLEIVNNGTQIAYGVRVEDTLPAGLTPDVPSHNALHLRLVDAAGNPGQPVDPAGEVIGNDVPITFTQAGGVMTWIFGSNNPSDPLYYRNVGLQPGQRQLIEIYAWVNRDVQNAAVLTNTATVYLMNRDDTEPPELYLTNNTDTSALTVWRPNLAVRKSGADLVANSEEYTEAGRTLTYTISYQNLGYGPARDVTISEIVPEGATLVSVNVPGGADVAYRPGPGPGGARTFDVSFPVLPAPANMAGALTPPSDVQVFNGRLVRFGEGQVKIVNGQPRAMELADDRNGIPPNSIQYSDHFGVDVAGIGDVDGDGVPDIVVGAGNNGDGGDGCGAVWVLLLNADGTVKSAIELANDKNGIPANSLAVGAHFGRSVAGLGDLNADGVPDIVVGAPRHSGVVGSVWVLLLNADGTAQSAIELTNGKNGIPVDSIAPADLFGGGVATIGDVDGNGVPDIVVGAGGNNDGAPGSGAAWVVLLNTDGTARAAIELANGKNGIPSGSFASYDEFGNSVAGVGDVDGDGVPDIVVGAYRNDDGVANSGAVWMIFLNADGTAKSATELANGQNGIPVGSFTMNEEFGVRVARLGDLNEDGIPDIVVGASGRSDWRGAAWVVLLDSSGSAKNAVRFADGENGIPSGSLPAYTGFGSAVTGIGDVNGDGVPDILVGEDGYLTAAAWLFQLSAGAYYPAGYVEVPLTPDAGWTAWDRLFSDSEIPEGTSLVYSVGRIVGGTPTYDLGPQWTAIAGPLPSDGLDLSSLPESALVARVEFATTVPNFPGARTPWLKNVYATYRSTIWPSFTFTVQVQNPVPARVLPTIENTVSIATSTPELRYDDNEASDEINVRMTDLTIVKASDRQAVLEGQTVTFTLDWRNNGPQDAVAAVVTDTLPAGLSYVSATPAPATIAGQVLTWNLGNLSVGASGTITVSATVNTGTSGQTLVNTARISNDRQETTYENNDDSVPVVVATLANVYIQKTGPATAPLGGQVTFVLTYGNNGNAPAAGVVVTDTLPAGLTFASADPPWSSLSGQTATWALGTLAVGGTGTITVTADVGSDYASLHNRVLVNLAQVVTSSAEATLGDNQDSHPISVLGAPAGISGYVWLDRDADAVWDADEPGIENITLTLTGTDVYGNAITLSTTTDRSGYYSFPGLPPGTYTVTKTQPAGYVSTGDVLGTVYNTSTGAPPGSPSGVNGNPTDNVLASIEIGPGDRGLQYNFGQSNAVSLGDFIWQDLDADGIQDAGEPGIAGALVQLFLADGVTPATDFSGNPVPPQTTGADGLYNFTNLRAGDYVVRVTPPAGYQATVFGGDPDNDDNTDSNGVPSPDGTYAQSLPITLLAGTEPENDGDGSAGNRTLDFGFYRLASTGGFVWVDLDGNGVQDAGEPGLNGVTVELYRVGTTEPLRSQTTQDSDGQPGYYRFADLEPGEYYVRFIPPAGYEFTVQNAGTDDAVDSDADPATGQTLPVVLASGERNLALDGGLQLLNPTGARLAYFKAVTVRVGIVQVTWGTLVENHVLGFRVERSTADGGWQRLTAQMIPATGGDGRPQRYELTDRNAPEVADLRYRLAGIDLMGREYEMAVAKVEAGMTTSIAGTESGLSLSLRGAPNASVTVQTAEAVEGPWTVVQTVTLDGAGAAVLNLGFDFSGPARFYRVVSE